MINDDNSGDGKVFLKVVYTNSPFLKNVRETYIF